MNVVPLRCSEGAQAAALIAEVRLDEGVGDPGLHGAQGSLKVPGLDAASSDVVLEGQEGGLPAYCGYLRQETDTVIQRPPAGHGTLSGSAADFLLPRLATICPSSRFQTSHKRTETAAVTFRERLCTRRWSDSLPNRWRRRRLMKARHLSHGSTLLLLPS